MHLLTSVPWSLFLPLQSLSTAIKIFWCLFILDMISALSSLTPSEKLNPCVSYALAFRSAWSLNNYHQVFKLYKAAPKMTGFVIDMFLTRERIQALKIAVKAYVFLIY